MDGTGDAAVSGPETVEARVEHSLFASEDDGWAALRCVGEDGARFTVVGTLLGVQVGDQLQLSGRWVDHPRFGRQLEVATFVHVDPSTPAGIRRFLASGRIRGLGPRLAERIVDHFGLDTLDVIEHHPERLRQVRGIGRKTLARIRASWDEHRGVRQIMVFLGGHGVSPGLAGKVFRRYGATALETVRSNPYQLAEDIVGVGFVTADRIALSLGLPADAPERLRAGLVHALEEATGEGHVFLPRDALLASAAGLLGSDAAPLEAALETLAAEERVVLRPRAEAEPAVFHPRLEQAEATVAERLAALLASRQGSSRIEVERALEWYQRRARIALAARQREALAAALTARVLLITGGPGTGKTTLVRGLTEILGRRDAAIELAAPTGRAAKRLGEATGLAARTIHRLLEFNPAFRDFGRDRDNPLKADLVVIDEASMLDIELAASLLDAIPDSCRLVLVGDADQLPSVGPGNVVADIIASGIVPVVRLEQIFRQAEGSLIVVNAHRVNRGEMPILPRGEDPADFYFVERDDPERAAELAIEMVSRRIPARFELDPVDHIQLITPMHRGPLGVTSLNQRLQEILTPPGPELVVGGRGFRVGDKVMQVRNNYELDVFNGDIGRVTHIDDEERELAVSFDGRPVRIDSDGLDDLVPAYACTIHKSQGSEYPAVVAIVHHQHHIMLQRNLLYTAITRGKRLVVLIGSRRALGRAVHNATVRARHTMLAERLAAGAAPPQQR